jgi:hypothetical protein
MRFIAVVSLTIAAPIPIPANAAIQKAGKGLQQTGLLGYFKRLFAPRVRVVSQDPLAAAKAELSKAQDDLDNYIWPKGQFRLLEDTDRRKVDDLEYEIQFAKEKVALIGKKPAAKVIVQNNFDSPEIQKLRAQLRSAEGELAEASDLYGEERFKEFDGKISETNPDLLRAVETAQKKVAGIQERIQSVLNAGAKQPAHQIHEPSQMLEVWDQG